MAWNREELEQAFTDYQERVVRATETGDWSHFAASFTEDATYVEHAFGTFRGREEITAWAQRTMTRFPATEMTAFPPTWSTIDTERGWVLCEIANPMRDPGDGTVIAPANVTILRYGGDGLWREEEDVYNPLNFQADVTRWLRIAAAHDNLTDGARKWAAKFRIDLAPDPAGTPNAAGAPAGEAASDPVAHARELARSAHAGQTDKMGRDYFDHHLSGVAGRLVEHGPDAVVAGYLHDIIEDTDTTEQDLRDAGIPDAVVAAIVAVTKVPGETYDGLITRSAADPLGRLVKLADNAQNLADNAALAERDPEAAAKLRQKYLRARAYLETGAWPDPEPPRTDDT